MKKTNKNKGKKTRRTNKNKNIKLKQNENLNNKNSLLSKSMLHNVTKNHTSKQIYYHKKIISKGQRWSTPISPLISFKPLHIIR